MLEQIAAMAGFFAGFMIVALCAARVGAQALETQQRLVQDGQLTSGQIVSIGQPLIPGSHPRIYFEFQPEETGAVIRGCHLDRRLAGEPAASLPAVGSTVAVRYLPDDPRQAVIARLVSRFQR